MMHLCGGQVVRVVAKYSPTHTRVDVLKILGLPITKKGDIDYGSVVKLADGFNAADLHNVCTEAGMFAIRGERDYGLCGGGGLYEGGAQGGREQEAGGQARVLEGLSAPEPPGPRAVVHDGRRTGDPRACALADLHVALNSNCFFTVIAWKVCHLPSLP